MNHELPDVQVGYRQGRGTRDQAANIRWVVEKARESQKSISFCFTGCAEASACVGHNRLWETLKEMGTPDHLTCLLRDLHEGQEAAVRTWNDRLVPDQERSTYIKAVCCHPAYLACMQSTSCEMPGWVKHKLESRLPGEISVTSDMQMTPPLWQKVKKSLFMKVKEESEKADLKLNIQKTKIMASGPVTSWQIDGEIVETVREFIFLGSKITADGDFSHKIKKHLLLGRKAMTNLHSIFKNRDINLLTKVHLVKAMVFPVVMYGCESWTLKKAE